MIMKFIKRKIIIKKYSKNLMKNQRIMLQERYIRKTPRIINQLFLHNIFRGFKKEVEGLWRRI